MRLKTPKKKLNGSVNFFFNYPYIKLKQIIIFALTIKNVLSLLLAAYNFWSPIILIKEFKKNLPKNASGNIINIIDQRVLNLTPFFTTYTFTKSGLWTLTKTLAMALAPNIRVNAIGPGPTLASKRQTDKKFKKQYKSMPLKKKVSPKEIADAVIFIINTQSITGLLITVDSGQHLGWAHNKKNILDE